MTNNVFDVYICDQDGNDYDINTVNVYGGDMLEISIKRKEQDYYSYIPLNVSRSIILTCNKYNIPLEDLDKVLEEYIQEDNRGWSD